MTADAAVHPAVTGLNSRLAGLLGALSDGTAPPPENCPECQAALTGWCDPCEQTLAEIILLDAVAAEISRPGTTAAAALALYAKTFIMLTRLRPGEFTQLLTTGDTE